jgi:hypothetical protein
VIWSPNVETIESGNVSVTNFPATQPVSGTVSVGNFPAVQPINDNGGSVTIDGTISVNNFPGSSVATATVTNVPTTSSAVTLAAANAARVKLIVTTDAGTTFVKLGTGASLSSYTYRLPLNTTLEIEQYTGPVTAIRSSGTGFVLVTEL